MTADGITAVGGIRVGHYTDVEAATGCTVVLCESGAVGGVDVRGSAPGTRETDLLRPTTLVSEVHAVLLGGGSAFGLDAASGGRTFSGGKGCRAGARRKQDTHSPGGYPFRSRSGHRPGAAWGKRGVRGV